jgi:hypothetical protein
LSIARDREFALGLAAAAADDADADSNHRYLNGTSATNTMTFPQRYNSVYREDDAPPTSVTSSSNSASAAPRPINTSASDSAEGAQLAAFLNTIKPTAHHTNQCCVICLEPFLPNASVKQMRCGHVFHGPCIAEWLGVAESCPSCRRGVFE